MQRLGGWVAVAAAAVAGAALGVAVVSWQAANAARSEAAELREQVSALERQVAAAAQLEQRERDTRAVAQRAVESTVFLMEALFSFVGGGGGCVAEALEGVNANASSAMELLFADDRGGRVSYVSGTKARIRTCFAGR